MDLDGNTEPRPRHVKRGRKKSSVKEICEPLPLVALDGKSPEKSEELGSVNKFSGPHHGMTRKGLKLERKFELRRQELPKHSLDKFNRETPEGSIDSIDTPVHNEPLPRRCMPQRKMTPKALFSSPPRLRPVPAPISSPPDTIPGTLSVGTDSDGILHYRVKISDGGIINLSAIEVEELRRKNNGVLPRGVNVPLVKRRIY